MRSLQFLPSAAVAMTFIASTASAQADPAAAQRRLQQALDPGTYRAVSSVFERARTRGVPVAPLVNRALQGTLQGTAGTRIHDAVSALSERLVVSKAALGPVASDAEIAAGANALAVGVSRETLMQIRTLSGGRPVTVPLGVLTELVAREIPVDRASREVVALLRNGATASQLVSLNEDVKHDVDAGMAPAAAFAVRTQSVLGTLEQAGVNAERAFTEPGRAATTSAPPSPALKVPRKP